VTQPGLVRTSLPVQGLPTLGDLTGIRLSKAQTRPALISATDLGGVFHDYTLITHLKTALDEQFTGTLVIKTAEGHQLRMQGAIWLEQGELCHAEIIREELAPIDGLYELVCLPSGYIQKIQGARTPFRSLCDMPTDLLLEDLQAQQAEYQQLIATLSEAAVPAPTAKAALGSHDPQQKALLALVDGKTTLAELQTRAPMDRISMLRALHALQSRDLVAFPPAAMPGLQAG
jgi:hypothetical protein